MKQGIDSFVCFALVVINLEVVTRKYLSRADLFGAQTLYVYEPKEVIVTGEYEHLMLKAFSIVPSSLESLINC